MSTRNWKRHAQAERIRRQGTEERDIGDKLPPIASTCRAPVMSKEQLRREADRLLASYTGPVTKAPAVASTNTGAGQPTFQSNRKADGAGSKARKYKTRRAQGNLFADRKGSPQAAKIDRAVPQGLVIYCDGACEPNPGAGGWGFAVFRDGVEIHSDCGGSADTTNNIMEMTGALMALRWFSERGVVEPVRILCDSQYVVNGCNDWRLSWKARGWKRKGKNPEIANLDLWKELDEALTAAPIRLEWVKGHAGIIGNERADELSLIGREAALVAEADDCGDLIAEQLRYEVV